MAVDVDWDTFTNNSCLKIKIVVLTLINDDCQTYCNI